MKIFTLLDWSVLFIFFVILAIIIYWVIKQKQESSEDYFLASYTPENREISHSMRLDIQL